MRLALALLLVSACSDPAQAVADLVSPAPPPDLRRAPAPSMEMQSTLCCVGPMCVQPRLRQKACDRGTEARICKTTRLAETGPLWACR